MGVVCTRMKTKAVKRLEALQRAQSSLTDLERSLEDTKRHGKTIQRVGQGPMADMTYRLSKESNKAHQDMIYRCIEKTAAHVAHLKTLVAAGKPY